MVLFIIRRGTRAASRRRKRQISSLRSNAPLTQSPGEGETESSKGEGKEEERFAERKSVPRPPKVKSRD